MKKLIDEPVRSRIVSVTRRLLQYMANEDETDYSTTMVSEADDLWIPTWMELYGTSTSTYQDYLPAELIHPFTKNVLTELHIQVI